MKCDCGSYITQQARVVANMYGSTADCCIRCLAEKLNVPYQELLDRYMGYNDCRECTKNKEKEAIRRRLLGLD